MLSLSGLPSWIWKPKQSVLLQGRRPKIWTLVAPDRPNLIDLPGELLNKIYRYCFILDEWINGHGDTYNQYLRVCNECEASSQLLRVSKQIYREGISILYAGNKFYAPSYGKLNFRTAPWARHTFQIRDLKIGYNHRQVYDPDIFHAFPNLKRLHLKYDRNGGREKDLLDAAKRVLLQCSTVGSREFLLLPHLDRLPKISQSLSDKCRSPDGLETYLDVFVKDDCTMERYPWDGIYRYRIRPTMKGSPENSSLIQENYDLVFESHKWSDKGFDEQADGAILGNDHDTRELLGTFHSES